MEHEQQKVLAVAFSPDGSLLVSGGRDRNVVFSEVSWDEDGPSVEPTAETVFASNTIYALDFSPGGETLAIGHGDGGFCFVDVRTRRYLGGCPQGYGDASIDAIRFAPDGSALVTAGQGNPIVSWDQLLWNLDSDDATVDALTANVCELAGRNLREDEWDQVFANTEFEGDRHQTCEQYPLP